MAGVFFDGRRAFDDGVNLGLFALDSVPLPDIVLLL